MRWRSPLCKRFEPICTSSSHSPPDGEAQLRGNRRSVVHNIASRSLTLDMQHKNTAIAFIAHDLGGVVVKKVSKRLPICTTRHISSDSLQALVMDARNKVNSLIANKVHRLVSRAFYRRCVINSSLTSGARCFLALLIALIVGPRGLI
jgi:hypothetical protein